MDLIDFFLLFFLLKFSILRTSDLDAPDRCVEVKGGSLRLRLVCTGAEGTPNWVFIILMRHVNSKSILPNLKKSNSRLHRKSLQSSTLDIVDRNTYIY